VQLEPVVSIGARMDYIEKTPILSGRQNKQFAIPFKKKEVGGKA
jgi:hypothetical protein